MNGEFKGASPIKKPPLQFDTLRLGPQFNDVNFEGIVDEMRFSRVARYTENFQPAERFEPDDKTVVLYHFDEGSGDILKDSSGNGHDGKIDGAKWVRVDNNSVPNFVPDPADDSENLRWPLESSRPEDIAWLQSLQATLTLRTGPRQDEELKPEDPLPSEPATIIGIDFSNSPRIEITDEVFKRVATLTDLEALNLQFGTGIRVPTTDGLSYLTSLINLRSLDLSGIGSPETDPSFLAALPRLEKLHIAYGAAYPWEQGVIRSKSLQSLSLYHLLPNDWEPFAQMPRLQSVSLTGRSGSRPDREAAARKFAALAPWCRLVIYDIGNREGATVIEPVAPRLNTEAAEPSAEWARAEKDNFSNVVPDSADESENIRWLLEPTRREEIAALQRLGARITLRTGPDQETVLQNTSAQLPDIPATIVGISFKPSILRDPDHLAEILELVASLKDLEKLGLKFGSFTELPQNVTHADVRQLAGLPHLQELGMQGIDDIIPREGFLESFPDLRHLFVGFAGFSRNDRGYWEESIAKMPVLERLDFYNVKLNDISKLQQAPSLTEVLLRGSVDKQEEERLSDARKLQAVMPWCKIGVGTGEVETIFEPTAPHPREQSSHVPQPAVAPFDEAQAKAHQQAWADYLGEPVVTTNSIGIKLAVIPPGEFAMGADHWGADVTLRRPFRMAVHEVTQRQWRDIMQTQPWKGKGEIQEGDNVAATWVSWFDAVEFCRKLTELERETGKLRDGWEYRLPTEAEWEFACRSGSAERYFFGRMDSDLDEYSWYKENAHLVENENFAHQVGLKASNPWGLYDMHGNVSEWCHDWYGDLVNGMDPTGPTDGTQRLSKGGNYFSPPLGCASWNRFTVEPQSKFSRQGFRVVLAPSK